MDATAEGSDNSFIYTNWREKSLIIDERFAKAFREYLVEEGERPEDVAYLTPARIMEELPDHESEEWWRQLEGMWEMPEAKTDR